MKRRMSQGFTLIELMVTVAVVAIIAAVALPSYQSQVRKSRRADAVAAVSVIQQAEERWRANNTSYTATLGTGGLGLTVNASSQYPSTGGYYTLSVDPTMLSGGRYVITATAVSGTSQASDSAGGTSCASLVVDVTGGVATHTPTDCWSK